MFRSLGGKPSSKASLLIQMGINWGIFFSLWFLLLLQSRSVSNFLLLVKVIPLINRPFITTSLQ